MEEKKNKGGRPNIRGKRVMRSFYVKPEEYELIKAAAKKAGSNTTMFITETVVEKAKEILAKDE